MTRIELVAAAAFLVWSSAASATDRPELVVQAGHSDWLAAIAVSPDGRTIATAANDQTVRLWEIKTGKELRRFVGHASGVFALAFTPEGKSLVTAGFDGKARLFDVATGALVRQIVSVGEVVDSIALSADGRLLATSSRGGTAMVTELASGKVVNTFPHPRGVGGVALSADGGTLLTGCWNHNAAVWDVKSKSVRRTLVAKDNIGKVHLTPGGLAIVLASNAEVIAWDASSGSEEWRRAMPDKPNGSALSADGKLLAIGAGKDMVLLDAATGKDLRRFTGHKERVNAIGFSPDGRYIASGAFDDTARVYETATGNLVRVFGGLNRKVNAVASGANGRLVLTGGYRDNFVRLWDLSVGRQVQTFAGHKDGINGVALSPDGRLALSGSTDNTAILWDVATGKPLHRLAGHSNYVGAVAFCPDGTCLLTGSGDQTVRVWSIATGRELRQFSTGGGVTALAVMPDAKTLVTGDLSKSIKTWDLATGSRRTTTQLSDYPDRAAPLSNELVAVATFSGVVLVVPGGSNPKLFGEQAMSVAASRDGKQIAAGLARCVRLHDASGAKLAEACEHDSEVRAVTFSADGKLVISGSYDGTVRLWSAKDLKPLATLVSIGETDYIAVTADGHYASSRGAHRGVAFRSGGRTWPFEQFDLRLNRPDVVAQQLGYASADVVASYHKAWQKRVARLGFSEAQLSGDLDLPEISIAEPPPYSTASRQLSFTAVASDAKHELDRLLVYVNDVAVFGSAGLSLRGKGKKAEQRISFPLGGGRNKVQVSALNTAGVESLRETFEVTYTGKVEKPDLYVVAVGVSKYQDSRYDLTYAAKDAVDVVAAFKGKSGSFKAVHAVAITDAEATRENILKTRELLAQSKVDDQVVLFVAGHGVLDDKLDYYLGTHDMSFETPAAAGLAYDELEGLLDGIGARRKLLMVDACHSGEVDKGEVALVASAAAAPSEAAQVKSRGIRVAKKKSGVGLKSSFELVQEMFADLRRGSGTVVISSASGLEFALESSEWKNGVFTYSVLSSLRARPSQRVSELRDSVVTKVQELTGGRQTPTARRENLEADFLLY